MEWTGPPSRDQASTLMTAGARTPEELDTLIEDAFLQRDRAALDDLFDDGAVLVDGGGAPRTDAKRSAARSPSCGAAGRTYVARPQQVLQARDTALVVADAGIHVLRRGGDGAWRATISLLELDRPTAPADA